jgi:hypothetical protein
MTRLIGRMQTGCQVGDFLAVINFGENTNSNTKCHRSQKEQPSVSSPKFILGHLKRGEGPNKSFNEHRKYSVSRCCFFLLGARWTLGDAPRDSLLSFAVT